MPQFFQWFPQVYDLFESSQLYEVDIITSISQVKIL